MAPQVTQIPFTFPTESQAYTPVEVQYHELAPGRRIAYRKFEGTQEAGPTLLYIPGFFSNMELNKVVVLEQFAKAKNLSNLRYDQECVGLSTGDQRTIEFSDWIEDALCMLDLHTSGPVILVASSLGSWISTIVAQKRPDRIAGMLFLGPGFNCLWPGYWFVYNSLSQEEKEKADIGGEPLRIKMRYGGWGILRKDFCERTRQYEIDFEQPVDIGTIPVRIIHGIKDRDVPHEFCLMALQQFSTKDFEVVYRKVGDHRLMTPQDIHLITSEVDRLVQHTKALSKGLKSAFPLFAKL